MKEKLVPSAWLVQQGRRLDCGPYLSGAVEAKLLLRGLPVRCSELRELTHGYEGGIFKGPMFSRNYVSNPNFGVSFLSSSGILHAEFTYADPLRWIDANSPRLAPLQLEEGDYVGKCRSGALTQGAASAGGCSALSRAG